MLNIISKPLGTVPHYDKWEKKILHIPNPDYIVLPLEYPGQILHKPTVQIGEQVYKNQIIGESNLGLCVHSPINGVVEDILSVWTARSFHVPAILIRRNDICNPQDQIPNGEKTDLPLIPKLKSLGVISPWTTPGRFHHEEIDDNFPRLKKIIIKGVNEEPGVFVFELLLEQEVDTILEGLKSISHLAPRAEVYLTVPEYLFDFAQKKFGHLVEVISLSRNYRDRIEALTVPKITKMNIQNTQPYRAYGIGVISVEYLFNLCKALNKNQPFIYKYLTISGTNIPKPYTVRIPIGTTIRHVLHSLGLSVTSYSKILVGGPMKGIAQYTDLTPLTKTSHGLYLLEEEKIPSEVNLTCINCGKCTRICPVNLQVHLIGRFAEYNRFLDLFDLHPEACNECGLCAYVCPAHRPLVQLIQLSKKYTERQDEYKSQIECSSQSTLERWERDFQNSKNLVDSTVTGITGQPLQMEV